MQVNTCAVQSNLLLFLFSQQACRLKTKMTSLLGLYFYLLRSEPYLEGVYECDKKLTECKIRVKNTSRDSLEWPIKSGSAFSVTAARAGYSCRRGFTQGPEPFEPVSAAGKLVISDGTLKNGDRQSMPESHAANLISDMCNCAAHGMKILWLCAIQSLNLDCEVQRS